MSKLINQLIIILFSVGLLFNQDLLRVNQTSVQGNIRLSDSEIYGISNIYPGMIIKSDEIQASFILFLN